MLPRSLRLPKANRFNPTPKGLVGEWYHTWYLERDLRRSATESRPAQLGLDQRLPGPVVPRRWCRRFLDYLETSAYALHPPSHPQKSRGDESLVKQRRMLHARGRYAVSAVLLQGFDCLRGFQLAA